eukprot:CAMPEP_0174304996 /NCGR_PEP_ID=MMETSP0809-20121228/61144_1 /TAXON_ID=73025 ORGANISM="Eutreptiella gymnastica-like, Strain CCMP1594" /NCGR_SAMPLE_ID=MMETSP0809 /ASSEMBLY_ACC=CAM_ASM_000658 /LENGTH=73 /DNA_ID=CAMNT_0015411379 /DNA_START=224 /DNA_END=445 /DNA_ORIENTATION=+
MRTLERLKDKETSNDIVSVMEHNRILRNQRNAYISGFGLFMFFLCCRLVYLMNKLHQEREKEKAHEADQNKDD